MKPLPPAPSPTKSDLTPMTFIQERLEEFRQKFGDSAPRIAMRSFDDCDNIEVWLTTTLTEVDKQACERGISEGKRMGLESAYKILADWECKNRNTPLREHYGVTLAMEKIKDALTPNISNDN